MYKSEITDGAAFVMLAAIVIGIVILLVNCTNNYGESKYQSLIDHYVTFTVNGENYNTEDVVDVDYSTHTYATDTIIFTMKDGSRIETKEGSISWHKEK